MEYKPILNTRFSYNNLRIHKFDNLLTFLKDRQRPITESRTNKKEFTTYLYQYIIDSKPNKGHIKFIDYDSNLTKVKNITGIRQNTIVNYINTDYPKNGYLFYSSPLDNLLKYFNLISKLITERPNKCNKFINVWAYKIDKKGELKLINNKPFESKKSFSNYIGLNLSTVNEYINSLKPDSKKGIYYFDSPIINEQIYSIMNNLIYLKSRKTKIFLYNTLNMKLINKKPFEFTKDAIEFLGIHAKTFYKKVDSNKAIFSNGNYYYALRQTFNSSFMNKSELKSYFLKN